LSDSDSQNPAIVEETYKNLITDCPSDTYYDFDLYFIPNTIAEPTSDTILEEDVDFSSYEESTYDFEE